MTHDRYDADSGPERAAVLKVVEIVVAIILALVVLLTIGFYVIFTPSKNLPQLFGHIICTAGSSSINDIDEGDVVFASVKEAENVGAGSVVLCKVEEDANPALLRIREVQKEGDKVYYILKADDTPDNLSIRLPQDAILAKAVKRNAGFGKFLAFAKSETGIIVMIIIPCVLLILWQVIRIIRLKMLDQDAAVYERALEDDDYYGDEEEASDGFLEDHSDVGAYVYEDARPQYAPVSRKQTQGAAAYRNVQKSQPAYSEPQGPVNGRPAAAQQTGAQLGYGNYEQPAASVNAFDDLQNLNGANGAVRNVPPRQGQGRPADNAFAAGAQQRPSGVTGRSGPYYAPVGQRSAANTPSDWQTPPVHGTGVAGQGTAQNHVASNAYHNQAVTSPEQPQKPQRPVWAPTRPVTEDTWEQQERAVNRSAAANMSGGAVSSPNLSMQNAAYHEPGAAEPVRPAKTYYETAKVPEVPPLVDNPAAITIPAAAVKPKQTIAPPPKKSNNKTVEELMKVIDQAQSGLKK